MTNNNKKVNKFTLNMFILSKLQVVNVFFPVIFVFALPWNNTNKYIEQELYISSTEENEFPTTTDFSETLNSTEANQHQIEAVEVAETNIGFINNPTTTTITKTTHANQEGDEDEEESEEENTDIVQSLISTFLGGLSTPEGGVDVDAIVGLVGGLSVPNDDGTYDFSGLAETLQTVLGPEAEGGGSDVGSFLGGLIGAFVRGVAIPPGAKGAGTLAGRLITAVLPGLSGPVPPPEDPNEPQALDSAGFFHGLIAGSSSTNMTGNGKLTSVGRIKQTVFKSIVSFITSFFMKPAKSGWY